MVKLLKDRLKDSTLIRSIQLEITKAKIAIKGEKKWAAEKYEREIGKPIDLDHPQTLNEKSVWLKLNYYQPFYKECCDKYLVHGYLEKRLGKDYAPKLLFVTRNPKELSVKKINKFPCIIKVSSGSGSNLIVNTPNQYTDEYLQKYFKLCIIAANRHTVNTSEHQYLKNKPFIVVEELLQDESGGIPNDYKFLYINGDLQFIYCSVDRLGSNVRHVYDKDWNRLHFIWVKGADKAMFEKFDGSPSIDRPVTFDKMKELSGELAKDFPLVRVDFYEVGNKLYIGEITLHHGSGGDAFYPDEFDLEYGKKLILPKANR